MRHIRMALGVAVAACALCIAALPALAATPTNFVANIPNKRISPEHPAKFSGKTEEPQVFKFGSATTISCQHFAFPEKYEEGKTAVTSGKVESETPTELEVGVHFEKCGYLTKDDKEEPEKSKFVPAKFKGKLTIDYHINGFVKLEGNGEGEEQEYAKATIRETAATFKVPAGKLCTVIIPEQTLPVKAEKDPTGEFTAFVPSNVFTPTSKKGFVNGEKESLLLENNFKGMLYRFAEETQCNVDEPHESGTLGTYTGSLPVEIPAGNIGVAEE
jgi:hypothetical protein